jgi:hypothetical protein
VGDLQEIETHKIRRTFMPKLWKRSARPAAFAIAFVLVLIHVSLMAQVNPLSAHVEITPMQNYTGADKLPKPSHILVYDFAISPDDVHVDKTQQVRLRHVIMGDENKKSVGENAVEELAKELVSRLQKTGIPVQRANANTTVPANSLLVQGAFLSVKEGTQIERETVGMGAGSAEVKTKVDVRYKASSEPVLFSQFGTDTSMSENLGAGVPAAMGVDPAAAAAKAKLSDRKKRVSAYAKNTADASARKIEEAMAAQGWISQ